MRLACPGCLATYEIPDALVGPGGRRLRCARCAVEWMAIPLTAPAGFSADAPDPPGPVSEVSGAAAPVMPGDRPLEPSDAPRPVEPPPAPAAPAPVTIVVPPQPPTVRTESRPFLAAGSRPESNLPPASPDAPSFAARAMVAIAWILSLAVLGGGIAACYVWRVEVMAAWPPSQRLYAALGVR